jgi:hypothetical protein
MQVKLRLKARSERILTRVKELIEKFSSLMREHSELQSDYLSERDNRRNYQSRAEEVHRAMNEHERQLVSPRLTSHLLDLLL